MALYKREVSQVELRSSSRVTGCGWTFYLAEQVTDYCT